MLEVDALVALSEPVISDVVSSMIGEACIRTAKRAQKSIYEMHPKNKAMTSAQIIGVLLTPQRVQDVTLTTLAALPQTNLTAAQLRSAVKTHCVAAVVQQLVCAELLKSTSEIFDEIEAAFILAMHRAVASIQAESHNLAEAAAELFQILRENTARTLTSADDVENRDQAPELFAQMTLIKASVDAIKNSVKSLQMRESANNEQHAAEWESLYRKQCAKHHGVITPPDFKERRTVALDKIYVPARISISDETGAQEHEASLYELLDKLDRDVLVGDPGGGKSTTTHAIALRLVESQSGILPFVVVLREYAQHYESLSIAEYIEKQLRTLYQAPIALGLLKGYLNAGEALVIFDGLDELLENNRRRAIAERIELFSSAYPMSRIYVTSRKVGYKEAQLDPQVFRVLELKGYSREEVEQYISKWFSIQPTTSDIDTQALQKSFIAESEAIPDLRSNPLLLALLCIIYRGQGYLPKNRIGIYEECSKLLFETWDKSRGIVFNFTFEGYISEALKHLAFWMWNNNDAEEGVTEQKLVNELTQFFSGRAYDTDEAARQAATQFVDFCSGRAWVLSEAGITPDHESLFKFTHRTFMEYFAAIQVNRLKPEPKALARFLLPKVARNEWDTVGQLCIHLIHRSADQGADVAIGQMLKSSESRSITYRENVLDFIARCLSDLPVAPKLIKKVIRASIDNLTKAHVQFAGNDINGMGFSSMSWRRLAQLDTNPDLVREEFSSIVDGLFNSEEPLHREVACLVSIDIMFSGSHPSLQFRGKQQYDWFEFTREKFRAHREAALGLEEFRPFIAVEMFLLEIITFKEYQRITSRQADLALDFIFQPLQVIADGSNHRSSSLSLSLISVGGNFTERAPAAKNRFEARWLEFLREVSAIVINADTPLVTKGLSAERVMTWYQFAIDVRTEVPDALQVEWATAFILMAIHLELEIDNSRDARRSWGQRGEESLTRLLASARESSGELPESIRARLEVASPPLREKLEAWTKRDLHFVAGSQAISSPSLSGPEAK